MEGQKLGGAGSITAPAALHRCSLSFSWSLKPQIYTILPSILRRSAQWISWYLHVWQHVAATKAVFITLFPTSLCGVIVFDSVPVSPPSRLLLRPFDTTLSHAIFHTQLCHTPSFTHNYVTHHLSHTTLSHTIFHTPLYHTTSFTHSSFTHTICHTTTLSHTILPHTTLSRTTFCHIQSFTRHFVTHSLSHTHTTLSHTIFHTQLCNTLISHTIFHTPSFTHHLCHTFSFTQLLKTSTCVWRGRRGNCLILLHLAGSGGALGHRWSPLVARGAAPLCVASVALLDIHLRFTWQAWHLETSTCIWRGRRGTCWSCCTWLALVARLVAVGRRGAQRHLWRLVTSTLQVNPSLSNTFKYDFVKHNFVTHNLHTYLSHMQLYRTQLCHTQIFRTPTFPHTSPSHTTFLPTTLSHTIFSHTSLSHLSHATSPSHLCHTQFCHTQLCHAQFFHTQLCHKHTTLSHTHNFVTRNSFTHTILSQTNLSHTTLSHTQSVTQLLCHTQLCHIQCTTLSHTTFCHIQYFTHITLSHTTLSHTTLSHTTLSQAIFHTQLCHTTLHIQLLKLLILHHLHFPFCLFLPAASTTVSDYWEKLTCGVIWSFHCTNIPSQAKNLQELSGHKVCSAVLRVIWPFALGWHVPHTLFMQNIGSNGQLLISSGLLVQK